MCRAFFQEEMKAMSTNKIVCRVHLLKQMMKFVNDHEKETFVASQEKKGRRKKKEEFQKSML